jgi:hypothetical protein
MNRLVVLVPVVLGLTAFDAHCILRLLKENQELQAKVGSLSAPKLPSRKLAAVENSNAENECARQARQVFGIEAAEGGWPKSTTLDYSYHYNARLNKCFVKIDSRQFIAPNSAAQGVFTVGTHILDAFANKQYGYCYYTLLSDTATMPCFVTLASGQQKSVRSPEEFLGLMTDYIMN